MLTMPGRSLLFFASYGPLFLILAIRKYEETTTLRGEIAGYTVLALGVLLLVVPMLIIVSTFAKYDRIRGRPKKINGQVEPMEKDTLFYFVTYVIPFVDVGEAGWVDLASYTVIFVVIYAMYVRSGLVYLNPVLSLLTYKTYKVSTQAGNVVLITRRPYKSGTNTEMVLIAEGVYYEPKR